jgi:hypothetical protein
MCVIYVCTKRACVFVCLCVCVCVCACVCVCGDDGGGSRGGVTHTQAAAGESERQAYYLD